MSEFGLARMMDLARVFIFAPLILLPACAPVMGAPSPVPIPKGYAAESGAGVMAGYRFNEPTRVPIVNSQFWYRQNLDNEQQQETGALLQVGFPAMISGGWFFRSPILRDSDSLVVSSQVELGLLWAACGVPIAFRLKETLWLTTHPTLRYSALSVLHAPLGLAWQVGNDARLDAGLGVHAFMVRHDNDLSNNLVLYGAVGLTRQW